jgi:hypothetical protein
LNLKFSFGFFLFLFGCGFRKGVYLKTKALGRHRTEQNQILNKIVVCSPVNALRLILLPNDIMMFAPNFWQYKKMSATEINFGASQPREIRRFGTFLQLKRLIFGVNGQGRSYCANDSR